MDIKGGRILKIGTGLGAAHANRQRKLEELDEAKLKTTVRVEFVTKVGIKTWRVLKGLDYTLKGGSGPREGKVAADGTLTEWKLEPGKYSLSFPKIEQTPATRYPDVESESVDELQVKAFGPLKWEDVFKPIEGIETGILNRVFIEQEVIPIIFVPGIMGSRLKRKVKGSNWKTWDPDDMAFMFRKYTTRGAAAKQRMLLFNANEAIDPAGLEPFEDDAEHNAKLAKRLRAEFARHCDKDEWRALVDERGWGAVAWGFYRDALEKLEAGHEWPEPAASFFRMPVYAFGYNWTDPCKTSGQKLKDRIGEITKRHREKGERCQKVMLVTHSMGGIVARAACKLHGAEHDVLGAVHGVQPVTGSAAAYWRMKAGSERVHTFDFFMAWTLGSTQAEVTAILGNIQGGLELLPNHLYSVDGGKPGGWLEIHGPRGELRRLPEVDPYDEIYLQEAVPYRLISKRYLLPGSSDPDQVSVTWLKSARLIRRARALHASLGVEHHPETHVFYGTEQKKRTEKKKHPTADRIVLKVEPCRPEVVAVDGVNVEVPPPAEGTEECAGGDYKVYVKDSGKLMEMVLQRQDGPGDGTVPESSGSAVKPCGQSHGGTPPEPRAFLGIGHSEAYREGAGRTGYGEDTLEFVVASIEKLWRMKVKTRS